MYEGSRFDRCRWRGCRAECVDEIELCWYHFRLAGETFIEKRSIWGASALAESKARREAERERERVESPRLTRDEWQRQRSVVYYIRMGDYMKIGYTIHIGDRMVGLRVDRDSLMAVEPGWREVEAQRHQQFAMERQGRRENFNPSRRLLAHVDMVRSKYGEPFAFAERRASAAGPQPAAV